MGSTQNSISVSVPVSVAMRAIYPCGASAIRVAALRLLADPGRLRGYMEVPSAFR